MRSAALQLVQKLLEVLLQRVDSWQDCLMMLLMYRRALRADIAAFAMVVYAKDEKAAAFYQHHGFLNLSTDSQTLFIAPAQLADHLAISR